MSAALEALYRSDGAMGVLRAFGLNRVLTEQDDPVLWAAALVRHWYAPGEAELHLAALRFGVSKLTPVPGVRGVKVGKGGMQELEVWCFELAEPGRLRPVACPEQPALSFMGSLMAGGLTATAQAGTWVQDILEVSRPSLSVSAALVHVGMLAPLNAGSGETRLWQRASNGTWIETDEVVSHWLT